MSQNDIQIVTITFVLVSFVFQRGLRRTLHSWLLQKDHGRYSGENLNDKLNPEHASNAG